MSKLKTFWFISVPFIVSLVGYSGYLATSTYKYNIVIDPGHGGLSLNPVSVHGDKYDPVKKAYLAPYQQGATYKNLHESEIVYEIAAEVIRIIELTHSRSGRDEFREILKKYKIPAEIMIEPIGISMSRPDGYPIKKVKSYDGRTDQDYNANFRLFDFPDFTSKKRTHGLISIINKKKPDLVISLHLDSDGPTYGAMAPVVTPGFDTYKLALDYIRGDEASRYKIRSDFKKSPYMNWTQVNRDRKAFESFLCDSWIYFTGYWSYQNGLHPDPNMFKGVREDYIDWKYQGKSWNSTDEVQGRQITHLRDFNPTGPFWEREQSEPERWRRENGPEGVGGDNLYSANELLRYVRLGLAASGRLSASRLPDIREPHWSTWSLPTYINAVSAYLELGFLNNRFDRDRIEKLKLIHAEGLAVGIYSLFYGLPDSELSIGNMPMGKPVDFAKYRNYNGRNYFLEAGD